MSLSLSVSLSISERLQITCGRKKQFVCGNGKKKIVSDGRTVPYGTNHKRYMPEKKIGAPKIDCTVPYGTIHKSYLKKIKWAHQKYTQKLPTWKKISAPKIDCTVLHGTIHKSYLKIRWACPKYKSKAQYYDAVHVHELKSTIPLHWVLRAYRPTYLPTNLPTYRQWALPNTGCCTGRLVHCSCV